MNRRRFLGKLALGGTALFAGCGKVLKDPEQYLWFLRIHNGSSESIELSVSVLRSGTKVFERYYPDIPSFQEADRENPSYAASENIQFIQEQWDPEPGNYAVEYSYRGDSTVQMVSDIEDVEAKHIGVEMLFLGGASGPPTEGFRTIEFESQRKVEEYLRSVDSEEEKSRPQGE